MRRARHERGAALATSVGTSLATIRCMFAGVKVFTATKAKERESLGEMVTAWLRENPRARIVDKIVTQSSDDQFHCLTITLFYATEE
jgi:hypothetical protein